MKYQIINGWTKESIVKHVTAQFKGKSEDAAHGCLYRGPEGTKCGVGVFIPDERYDRYMEGKHARSVIETFNLDRCMPFNLEGMLEFQGVHDGSHPDSTLKDMLQWIENNVE